MFKTIPRFAGLLALMIMIALPSLLLVKAAYDRHNGKIWRIEIAGYDPRDLLRGHYLNFRYDWNFAQTNDVRSCEYGKNCCLCLTEASPGNHMNPVAKTMACNAPEIRQCQSVVTSGRGVGPALGGHVYFIPEKQAAQVENLLRDEKQDVQMEIAVPRSGGPAIIRNLYIDQQPLEAFLLKEQEQP